MTSSYTRSITYLDLFSSIVFIKNPTYIVEFGILNGHSLKTFVDNADETCKIEAFDIFDEFNGNHARNDILEKFSEYKNVNIGYGDFYNKHEDFHDNSIDIMHVDIANNGDTYEFCIDRYLSKIVEDGILILEGGSVERDNIEWMIKYNKRSITQYLKELERNRKDLEVKIIGCIPSITIIKK